MAIQEINVGLVANDGTGDDLREAMIKINENFNELDLRESITVAGSNLGSTGNEVYKEVENGTLYFRRIIAGDNIEIDQTLTDLTFSAPDVIHVFTVEGDTGPAISVEENGRITVQGGRGVDTSVVNDNLVIDTTALLELADDSAPELSADLNANGRNLLNIGFAQGTFRGPLDGEVYGYDMRNIGPIFEDFDFGNFTNPVDTYFKWLISFSEVDLGTFDNPVIKNLDFGTF